MPLYDYLCDVCQETREVLASNNVPPSCCGAVMRRIYGPVSIRGSDAITGKRNELFIDRIDEIHKRQEQAGERLTFVHPSEVL